MPDTNTQAGRDQLRHQGFFIDNSGIYAPGSGQRVGDTWSGNNAHMNEAASPTQLPILNGHPVSPSNGFTGPQTPYIMYRGDPLYSQFFGQDTPGYSSTSKTYNATPGDLPENQATYEGTYGHDGVYGPPQVPAPAPAQNNSVSAPNGLHTVQQPESSADSTQRNADQAYLTQFQQPNTDGTGFGPYSTPQQPQLTVNGRYTDNGNIIEKSTDQYGHEYFQTVGAAPQGAPNTPHPPTPAQPAQPAQAAPAQPTGPVGPNGQPAQPAAPAGGVTHTVVGSDGKPYQATMTDQDWADYQQDKAAQAAAEKQARDFAQGIEQQKIDLEKSVAVWQKAYQDALLQYQDRSLAQQTAYQAMTVDLQKQAQELQRQSQAQNVSLEREKLDLARQQAGGRRRLPQVRTR